MTIVFRFLICSGLAALTNLAVGELLYGVMGFRIGLQYAASVSIAFFSGMTVSFFLNRRFTFVPTDRLIRHEFNDFFWISVGGLLLTTGISYFLFSRGQPLLKNIQDMAGTELPNANLAHLVAVALAAFYSFLAHKNISFRPAPPSQEGGF